MSVVADSSRSLPAWRANPVFWLMWLLPGSAVLAGLATLCIALRSADPPLPADYHWEGAHLDRDFELARNAADHGIEVDIAFTSGQCVAAVRAAPGDAPSLTMLFTNGTDAGLDRVVMLKRLAPGEYRGACAPLAAGRWRVSLEDAAATWSIRTQVTGGLERIALRARKPEGG
jgi:uncharacterized protein